MAAQVDRPCGCSPDWRWATAMEMCERNNPPSRSGDPNLLMAYRFLKRFRDADEKAMIELRRDYPYAAAAQALHQDITGPRWIIEAGLLTDAGYQAIGEYLGEAAKAVEIYGRFYFDVREPARPRGWILNHILIPPRLGGQPRDQDVFLKWLGFTFGWPALCQYLEGGALSPELRTRLTTVFRDEILRRSLEAARRIVPTAKNAAQIAELQMRMMDMDQRSGAPAESGALAELSQVFSQLRISVAEPIPMIDEPRDGEAVPGASPVAAASVTVAQKP